MNEYIFRTLVSLTSNAEDDEEDYVIITADYIRQARKKFSERAAVRYHAVAEWCLLAVYRRI